MTAIMRVALFAWLISRTFSANEQYFSLTTNQLTVLSGMAYQPSEQGNYAWWVLFMVSHGDRRILLVGIISPIILFPLNLETVIKGPLSKL